MRMSLLLAAVLVLATTTANAQMMPQSPVETRTVLYEQDGTTYEGFLAWPADADGPLPGIVIYHQWMGLTEYEKRRAQEIAALGYVAFAADLYGQGVRAADAGEAQNLATPFYQDRAMFRARVNRALEELKAQDMVGDELGAMGYCFGGTASLELARSGADIDGMVSFHGGLSNPTPADAGNIACPVLVLHGGDDPFVKPAEVNQFRKEMDEADVQYTFVSFANAVHAFTQPMAGDDPSRGAAYNAYADRMSWKMMEDFWLDSFGR